MHNAALQPPLPGVTGAEYIEGVIGKIRALYGIIKSPAAPGTLQAMFWDTVLDDRGRRYFLAIVKLPAELAEKKAAELEGGQLLTIMDGYLRLREYVDLLATGLRRARAELPR